MVELSEAEPDAPLAVTFIAEPIGLRMVGTANDEFMKQILYFVAKFLQERSKNYCHCGDCSAIRFLARDSPPLINGGLAGSSRKH